ncbi:MAG: sulfurtransferase TusA family protein [Candidatus Hodarchaeales archaeon]|jgi:TusA-related sulfurtransferase
MSNEVQADKVMDARNSFCPGPLMELIKSIKKGEIGKVYEVWSKDAGSIRDIPKWVEKAKHEMVAIIEVDGYKRFQIRKVR